MTNFKKLDQIIGWAMFGVATIVYFMTLEPTASWWDCGEYIATAYKLQVGHPPGAPTFQLIGRFFSLFAFGDNSRVALMINAMSAVSSGLTIMFLFWTITMLAKKILPVSGQDNRGNMFAVLGAGIVGGLAYTFSDSFWFSAVEGEVYGMSSLFTAMTFWAILRWETVADESHSLRWIILIAFLIGLSIGIHLLNLLAIPAVVFVYYFKRYKTSWKGIFIVFGISILLLAFIMYVIIPGIVSLSGAFELFFVNTIGMPFNSGTIIYFILLIGAIVWAHHYTWKKGKAVWNSIVLGLIFILIGYSSFFMLIIRSNADVPIDENSPEDAVGLLSYLNREQYGSYPIFHGQYYNAPVVDYGDGTPIYIKDKAKGKYIITDDRAGTEPIYDPDFTTIFPRMWSNQKQGHIDLYEQYGRVKGIPITVRKNDGSTETRYRPTFGENLRFFFSYQVSHMYIRYFMWNFVGRQNDIESQGEPDRGNWLSGIGFIDNMRLGNQDNLPVTRQNSAHNKFFFLPLILGLLGFFFHLSKHKKDTWVVALLFIMTGLAIVVYLNQHPLQPRERDYAYAGSFYAFAIWIGFGVLSLYDMVVKKFPKHEIAAIAVTVLSFLLVPVIMANQGWDDHDRSGKYAARDFAKNYLVACAPNSLIVTFGDNDTFPLWYVQEVEEFRTDVRVVNHMLASGSWYVQQLMKKAYDGDPVPLTLSHEQYEKGVNEYIPIYDRGIKGYTELKDVIDFIASESEQSKLTLQGGRKISYMPTRKVRLTVDADKCIQYGIVPAELKDQIVPYIEWEVTQSALFKNDLMILDFLATSDWTRPLYFANPSSLSEILNIDEYIHQEGLVYKFMPVKAKNYYRSIGGVDGEGTYDIFMNKCSWGNLNDPKVTVDRESARNSRLPRQNFLRAAETLFADGEKDKAIALLDNCMENFPENKFPFDAVILPFAELYLEAGEKAKGIDILKSLTDNYIAELNYINSLDPDFKRVYYQQDVQMAVSVLNRVRQLARQENMEDMASTIDSVIELNLGQ